MQFHDEVARLPSFEAHLGQFTVDLIEPIRNPQAHVPAPPPLNDLRQEIQQRLDVLEIKKREILHQQLELKSRWNSSLTVTQLPNEILFRIFVDISEQSKPLPVHDDEDHKDNKHKSDSEFRRAKLGWMKLTLVCRRWHDVAHATPPLWRTIDVGRTSSWLKLALARSCNATLDVSFISHFSEKHACLLKPHCHRLRSLRLRSWSPSALRQILRNILSALETLEIAGSPTTPGEVNTDLRLTAKRLPILRALHVAHILVPTDPSLYTRLRKLTLRACSFSGSVWEFVQLLSAIPLLEHLELDNFLQSLPDSAPVRLTRPLPSLRSLRLSNHSPVDSAQFLSQIVIPPTASLSILAYIGPLEFIQGDTLRTVVPPAPHLASSVPGLGSVTWARLFVTCDQYAIECPYAQPGREDSETLHIQLALTSAPVHGLSWDRCMPDGVADLLALLGSAPLRHLEVIGDCSPLEAGTWARIFRAFPSLMSFEADASGSMFAGLHEASLASPLDAPVACPGLERIAINDCPEAMGTWAELVLDPLINCLGSRAERGAQLKELQLQLNLDRTVDGDLVRYLPKLQDLALNIMFVPCNHFDSSEDSDEGSDAEEGWESESI